MELSNFRIENQRLTNLIFKVDKSYDSEEEIEYEFNTEIRVGKSEQVSDKALVSLKFEVFKEEQLGKNEIPYYLEATIEGIFGWDDGDFSEEKLNSLLNVNAPAVLLSYIRTSTSLMTVSAGLPPLVIPLMNFSK